MARITRGKKIFFAANAVVILALAGSTGYLFMQNRDLNEQLTLTTEEKNKRLIDEVNRVFDLPEEEPVVAIVTDPEEFKKQYAVFDNAESGDYLLFFRKSRLNVLYRQRDKKVVKTASVAVPITVEVVGSEAAIAATEQKLAQFGNQITLVKTIKTDITQSFIFDIDGDQQAEADSIAKQVGYEIGSSLPSSITPTNQTEIVVAVAGDGTSLLQPEADSVGSENITSEPEEPVAP